MTSNFSKSYNSANVWSVALHNGSVQICYLPSANAK